MCPVACAGIRSSLEPQGVLIDLFGQAAKHTTVSFDLVNVKQQPGTACTALIDWYEAVPVNTKYSPSREEKFTSSPGKAGKAVVPPVMMVPCNQRAVQS